jgi:hypothetical protein
MTTPSEPPTSGTDTTRGAPDDGNVVRLGKLVDFIKVATATNGDAGS